MYSFNQLTSAQAELLDILAEECAEVIQAVSKIKRHGLHSYHPDILESNSEALNRELGDVEAIKELLASANIIDYEVIKGYMCVKAEKLPDYMHHN